MCSHLSNWLVSLTSSGPSLGQIDDSIIGTAELTRSGVQFDKYHAMLLFQHISRLPSFADMNDADARITGRECFSKTLEGTPINFTREPEFYKRDMIPWITYDPSEIEVRIEKGKLLSGVLDKKSIGSNAKGGLYHLIALEYGSTRALDAIFDQQQLAMGYMRQFGFTIGVMDLLISKDAKAEIDRIAADIINKSRLITDLLDNEEIIPPIGKTVGEFYEELQINVVKVLDDFTEAILRGMEPFKNNLFKLTIFGSKGNLSNLCNIVSAVGQKLINGERIREQFGYRRASPHFTRFDTSPEARGYNPNSFLAGMSLSEYVFDAMASRFDLISKALSTSITGEQNRKSIKNNESLTVNNFRQCVKGNYIVDFGYGENFLDPRHVERVKFPTVGPSDAAFEKKYRNEAFPAEFETIRADRARYREIFMSIERMNTKELMQDERNMPVHVARIISYALTDAPKRDPPSDDEIAGMIETINAFCDGLVYVLVNGIQERLRAPVPTELRSAVWLLTMLIRSHLYSNALAEQRITPDMLTQILDKIRLRYSQALIAPGTPVGIIAAQSFSEPLTQYMLNAHHRSATGGTSKSTIISVKEVLGAYIVGKLRDPRMLVPIISEYAHDKAKVQEIANNIEVMKFKQFGSMWQIFFERFGEPVHSRYKQEGRALGEFVRMNPLIPPPGDLARWCVRFDITKGTLILKNMSLELLVRRVREQFPDAYVAYTPENAPRIVIRVYPRVIMFKGAITLGLIEDFKNNILETTIRGVDSILNTAIAPMLRNKIADDGAIVRDTGLWGVSTNGTNLYGIFCNKYVDAYNVLTDAIQEVAEVLGIEAARQKIISEMRNLIDICNHAHYLVYANEMTWTGRVTSIESKGVKIRERNNILLRMGFSAPFAALEEAAVRAAHDPVIGLSAPLMIGSVPKYGTLYNRFHVNEEFVRANMRNAEQYVEEL